MFFQFSPVRRATKPKPVVIENESEKIETLLLTPFTPNPKLSFDNIRIGETAARQLLIKNPTSHDIHLFLFRALPEELNVSYNWEEKVIEKDSEVIFEIKWSPIKKESVRHTITFKDLKKIQKDVHIAFTSVPQDKTKEINKERVRKKTIVKKSPTKKYYSTRPTKISPLKYSPSPKKSIFSNTNHPVQKEKSPKKHSPSLKEKQPSKTYSPNGNNLSHLMSDFSLSHSAYRVKDKENMPSFFLDSSRASEVFVSPKNVSFNMDYIQPTERRGTFVLEEVKKDTPTLSSPKDEFDDSLEIVSPTKSPKPDTRFSMYRQRVPLITYTGENIPASNQERVSMKTKSSLNFDFERKLNQFSFTPMTTPVKNCENIPPTFATALERFHLEMTPIGEVSPQNRTYELPLSNSLNISAETYIKSNLSGDTYVKGNTSFESYIRGNLSGGTYTKDTSIGDIDSLCISPLNSKVPSVTRKKISPTYRNKEVAPKSPSFIDTENIRKTIEANVWTGVERLQLSCIQEESYIHRSMRDSNVNLSHNTSSKRKSDIDFNMVYPKKMCTPCGAKDWSRKGGTAFRVAKKTSGLNLKKFKDTISEENLQHDADITMKESSTMIIQNPFILAATNFVDPFMTSNLYVNNEWIDQQEKDFKKWLNSLLTPPEELSSEERVIDVAKVWQECKKREIDAAPSKEMISSKYNSTKLKKLREAAQRLFMSNEIGVVLSKVTQAVETGKLSIRKDKDVHLNLSLKSGIIALLLSYNSLWLRIGLETIYNEVIPLNSNSDVIGLSTFIANRLLKDPYLLKKYKSVHLPKYKDEFNKFFLKKFLVLVYFLDQAKNRKLISHDPCLFRKNSVIKESKELLLQLARDILSAVGDINKFLKYSGYIVTYTQTYIHEFDYAVNNLGVDLRDGVRLTKIMEIILIRNDLSANLRVPAISRLQKVHNMKIVFESLQKAGYKILYDISPKDIVDGHKEKTLSFLWQIIYNFEAPLMVKSATTIQAWFRSLPVVLKRRKLERIRTRRENAAKKIQMWYRRHRLSEKFLHFVSLLKQYIEIMERERAAITIQSYFRRYYCQKIYKMKIETIIRIQSLSRGWLVRNVYRGRIKSAVIIQSFVRMYLLRKRYLEFKRATVLIQLRYRAQQQMKFDKYAYERLKYFVIFVQRKFRANRLALMDYQRYQKLKASVIAIQRRFRANRLCKHQHEKYLNFKSATIFIQTWYRSLTAMRLYRDRFLALKRGVLVLETRFLALKLMREERQRYIALRNASITIQQHYRAWKLMVKQRTQFLTYRKSATIIQQAFRAKIAMHCELVRYETLRSATIFTQRKFRANKLMINARERFLEIKSAVTKIQMWFRGTLELRKCRTYYLALKYAVRITEDIYQAKILMKKDLAHHQRLKCATILIQRKFRAQIIMRSTRESYCRLKSATLLIQRKFRAQKAGRMQRSEFLKQKEAAIAIQRRYRAQTSMLQCKKHFTELKMSAIVIQKLFRANIMMRNAKFDYQSLRETTILIQRKFRANKAMAKEREDYRRLRGATITIQQKWKALILMKKVKAQYTELREAAIIIQRRWHAKKQAEEAQKNYKALVRSVLIMQTRWRAKMIAKQTRESFIKFKWATVVLQQRWRAKKSCEQQQKIFHIIKNAASVIQKRWRANKEARTECCKFQNLKSATIMIQRRWRANKLAHLEQENYRRLRNAAMSIQRTWRARQEGIKQRNEFLQLKKFAIIIQIRWRAKVIAEQQKTYFNKLKQTTVYIQRRWVAKRLARKQRASYEVLRSSAIFIQNKWRAVKIGLKQRQHFKEMREATIKIQRRWRALRLGRLDRQRYLELRSAATIVQERWKAKKAMDEQVKRYAELKHTVILLQRRIRANLNMKKEMTSYRNLRNSTITIQRHYRAYIQMKKIRHEFLVTRNAVVALQGYARGYLVRRKYAYYFTAEAREQRKLLKIQSAAVVKIQSFWRGYKCRSAEGLELRKIRQQFKNANANAVPEKTLEWKCKVALQTFANTSSTLSHIILALKDIDFATRRCREICLELGSLLPDQLYLMLSATSRSLPEMNACIHSVNILISFCKFAPTRQNCFVPQYIDNLVNVMLHWCDKESQLFPTLCTLFWLFAHTPQWKRVILRLPNLDQRLNKIQSLVSRKESMVKRSTIKGVSHFASFKNLPMPSLTPDWGLDYKNKPNVFSNSVHALASLLSILNM